MFKYLENLIYIIEGYLKWCYDLLLKHISMRSAKRLVICKQCEHYKKGVCDICGCILKAKVRVDFILDEEGISIDGCPERKW